MKGKCAIDLLPKMTGNYAIGLLSKIGKCAVVCCFCELSGLLYAQLRCCLRVHVHDNDDNPSPGKCIFLNCMLLLY